MINQNKNIVNTTPLLFFGTPLFAVPALEALVKNGYSVVGVVTRPDEPAGRDQIITPPPVKVTAKRLGIPVFQPEGFDAKQFAEEVPSAELFVVAAYGKIIPHSILNLAPRGTLNIHPSLLPKWRGPSPIQSAIMAGDERTGVSIMLLDELMDHGPIMAQRTIPLPPRATYPVLHDTLAELGAAMLVETIPDYLSEKISPVAQNDERATFSKILKRNDGRAVWDRPAESIDRMVRALNPWPGVWTIWPGTNIYRLKIEEALAVTDTPAPGSAGYVWHNENFPLLVKTGHGSLAIKKAILGGRRSLTDAELARGYSAIIGATLV
ncbi:MAG: methionyl-tRNA formyltransferase [bacterium]|nr:methionyl-tRNA formyltransferase [bacterium]MDZ4299720.1 methionyl-tRNA formyltransferase [Candidatus Sungbacteria bacterium]